MSPPNSAEELVGAVLNGRWRLVKLLGEGGMGAVYEADGIHGEGKRAIKLLHQEFVREDAILQRFFAEARASQSLNHPNVAQVFDSATAENGTPYLVMELLTGTPLSTYTESGKPIPPLQAAPIVHGILQALVLAHAQRIVHRDLKPDNLFLVRDARGAFIVKVLDFGIAKVMDAAGGMGSKTRTGVLLGTPGYMSPEQIRNSKGVDPRSDLWSVGVIAYEMLTGQAPFPADNEFSRLTAVLVEEMRPIEQVAPQLAAWGPFFQRALAKDTAQRFQSADEMARALAALAWPGQAAAPGIAPASMAAAPTLGQGHGQGGYTAPAPPIAAAAAYTTSMQASAPSLQPRLLSAPPPVASSPAPLAPSPTQMSRAPGAPGPTFVSAQRPEGTPAVHSHVPQIDVVQARPLGGGAPYWVVGVVGFVCMGLGFVIGYLVH